VSSIKIGIDEPAKGDYGKMVTGMGIDESKEGVLL
jgi:hypothetical protein